MLFKPQSIVKDTSHITSILSSVGQGSCDAVAICPNGGGYLSGDKIYAHQIPLLITQFSLYPTTITIIRITPITNSHNDRKRKNAKADDI